MNQPIALLDFTYLLPLKVKQNFYFLELFGLLRSIDNVHWASQVLLQGTVETETHWIITSL
jgi:hypothetical protein